MKKRTCLNKLIISFCIIMLLFLTKYVSSSFAATLAGGAVSGTITLTEDTNLTNAFSIATGQSFVLDLNGHVLTSTSKTRLFVISADATVTIKDSNPNKVHYGTVSNGLWTYNASATSGTQINGGIITGGLTSDRGGAVFCSGNLIMEGGTIAGCKAMPNANANENNASDYPVNTFTNGTGGAVYLNEPATFIMNGGAIRYCTSVIGNSITVSKGGAVFIDSNNGKNSTFTLNDGIISNCTAMNGGAVFVHSNINTGNTLEDGASFLMIGGEITNCIATGIGVSDQNYGGGAVFVSATEAVGSSKKSVASFNMTGGTLSNNVAKGMGGAIFTYGKCTIEEGALLIGNETIKTDTIENGKNVYIGFGGAVFANKANANFTMNGGTISGCKAASGAGVMVYTSSTFTMNSGIIEECVSQGTGGTGNGGAVYVQASTFNFNNGTLRNCSASRYGGAININQTAKLYLNGDCNILNNSANHGGGISQEAGDCQVKLANENILIKGNNATGNGGGLFIEKGILEISDCVIEENIAGNNGGGIALRVERIGGDITVNMTGGTIRNNSASADGGAIDVFADYTFTADDTSGDANKQNDVVVNINNGIINGNNASGNGGGINVNVNEDNGIGEINVSDSGNICGTEIKNNTASKNGGGICINGGSINILDGNISDCNASLGGGAYISKGDFNITGGIIDNCNSTDGGGIYISNGNIYMNGGTVSNNQVTGHGGGIYASSDSQNLNITINSGNIINNISNGHGGAVGVNMGTGLKATIVVGLKTCSGMKNEHTHPVIKDNVANETGGAFCMHGDSISMSMYCGYIINNIAVIEPGSAGIYQTGGNATVYSGTIEDGVIVIGGKYDYVPDNNIPEVTITYNSNIEGNIETKEALVTVGVNIYLPTTLFTWDEHVLLGWSYSPNPTEEDEIFVAGTPYTVADTDVTVYAVWKLNGAGEIKTPVIKGGKHYKEITGESNVLITSNSSFTFQMIVNDVESYLYKNRTLSFDKNLPNGTKILMIDMIDTSLKKFYKYEIIDNNTNSILISSFKDIVTNEQYIEPTYETAVDEAYLFIVTFPNDNNMLGTTQVSLIRYSNKSDVADIKQTLSYTISDKRKFNLNYETIENPTVKDEIVFSYEEGKPLGIDSRYENRKLALIISAADGNSLVEETKIFDGTNYYKINDEGKCIIPLDSVTKDFKITLKLISNILYKNDFDTKIKAELMVSSNEASDKPFMGEVVSTIDEINLKSTDNPAIDISFNGRVKYADEMGDTITLDYETLNISDNYDITISVQKKIEEGIYETDSSLVQSISGGTDLGNGKYKLNLSDSGKIKITFLDNLILEKGTYRVYLEVKEDDKVILKVPYNFIILEKEEVQ